MSITMIEGGTVVDGSGGPRYRARVLVEGDRIAAILHDSEQPAADHMIDARGKVVCPGFVDVHSHADLYAHRPDHPRVFEPLIRQGITTFIGGNCGYGVAPIARERNLDAQRFYLEGVTAQRLDGELEWSGVGDYLALAERRGLALNAGLLCPHGLIRLQAMGPRRARATEAELAAMGRTLEQALAEGAFGLSTGLQYFPGLASDTRELVALGRILARHDARFTSHLRSYVSNTVQRALEEVIAVARETGAAAEVSHIFAVPWIGAAQPILVGLARAGARYHRISSRLVPERAVSGEMTRLLAVYERARARGLRLGMDVMPTTTGFTHLLAFFPPWVLTDSSEAIMARLRDPETRRAIVRDIERGTPLWPHDGDRDWSLNFFRIFGYGCARIMSVASPGNRKLEGRRLVEIAAERGQHPIEAACDLLLEEERRVLVFVSLDAPDDPFTSRSQFPAIAHPAVAISTDTILLGFGQPSFLFYGCFPRFLGFHVRERRLCDLETAIHKCTAAPARALGVRGRGVIERGAFADLVVLDPASVGSDADFDRPALYPRGIEHVLITASTSSTGSATMRRRSPGARSVADVPLSPELRRWRVRIFVATWVCYAGYYFGRQAFYVAKPELTLERGLDAATLGWIGVVFLGAYAAGEFVAAWMGTRIGARRTLLLGMALSALANLGFGAAGSAAALAALAGLNGLAQATGWPASIGTLAHWYARPELGQVTGWWSTCYQLGSVAAKSFAAMMLGRGGARWAFGGAAGVLAAVWAVVFALHRDRPQEVGLPAVGAEAPAAPDRAGTGSDGVAATVALMGGFYFFLKSIRYALLSWAPYFLQLNFGVPRGRAGHYAAVFDLCGFAGAVSAGTVSDRLLGGRRAGITLAMTVGLALASLALWQLGGRSPAAFTICLGAIGFLLYGPDVLISAAGAIDVGERRHALAAAGVINGMGSLGPVLHEALIGELYQRAPADLARVLGLLTVAALLAAALGGLLVLRSRAGKCAL
jgi:N-acyl-D-aspartate/D-glutamate deacylase/sugar phosphate permease